MAFSELPNDLIYEIISLLPTPQDACRASAVSKFFRSIADSDQVWLKILPLDPRDLDFLGIAPMKSLYLHLCDHWVPVGGNQNTVFSLDKKSGKKCFMIGARELSIAWGDDQRYWVWIAGRRLNSRFDQVAQLLIVWWFHITMRIDTNMLSPKTMYAAYLIFRFEDEEYREGFHRPMESRVSLENDQRGEWPNVILDPREGEPRLTRDRGDGWLEIEMGEFYNDNGEDGTLLCSLREVDNPKSGFTVEGIELRPKET